MSDEPKKIFDLMDTETEPTDEQLAELMRLVGNDIRAESARIKARLPAQPKKPHVRDGFSAPDKLEYIQKAQRAGFFVRFFFICTDDPSINRRRIERRLGEDGHGVPVEKIISRYSKSIAQCAIAVRLVDRAYVYDNSVEDADPRLLFRTEDGILKKVYREPVNDWAKPVLDQVR